MALAAIDGPSLASVGGAGVEFRVLGPLEVLEDARALPIPTGLQRTLLLLLIIHANRVLSAERIADDVWGGQLPASGTKALAFHVSRLRDALSPGRSDGAPTGGLTTEPGGYVLRVEPEVIDAVRFERLVRAAHGRLHEDPIAARAILDQALDLWRGDPLADVAYADFAQPEIRRLQGLHLDALEDRLETDLALGRNVAAVPELEALLEHDPLREHVRGLLMLALYRSGRQAEALRVAGAGRRLLSEELGIDPSPELLQLEARILAQDPSLRQGGPVPTVAARPRNPYKGLRAFGEADSIDFFGREALIGRLHSRIEELRHGSRLLAIVGPSGSGKSSVVRAGLLPAVRASAAADESTWRIATMVPGTAPFRELAAALAESGHRAAPAAVERAETTGHLSPLLEGALRGHRLLLVIDQFEELFVRVDEEVGDRFVRGLVAALAAPHDLVGVITLRADMLHVPLRQPGIGELIRSGIELITPLAREELERAILRPAEAVGVDVEPGLAAEMIADVEHRPGALPLLQYALTELFERSDGRRLTRDGYAAIGRVSGALGAQADAAWRGLDAAGREVAQQLLLGLVALTDSGVATTRPVLLAELDSLADDPEQARSVLDHLARRGLLTFDRDPVGREATVVIAHEALLEHWPRLSDWIDDLREDLWTRRRLADAAEEWEASGRSPGFLAGGSKLERFEAWANGTRLRLTASQEAYLEASVAERERISRLEAARVARDRRLERGARLVWRVLVGVVVVGVVLAGGLSVALITEQQAAVEQDDIARARELAVASEGKEPQLGILLALAAADATVGRGYVTEEAYDALQWALQDAQAAFPTGALPVGVRASPGGPRGIFLVGPEQLMRLASNMVERPLTTDECRIYLHRASCPPVGPPGNDVELDIRTVGGVIAADSLATDALPGTAVRVVSELPVDLASLAAPFEDASGIEVAWDQVEGDMDARLDQEPRPDVAIVWRPSSVARGASSGALLDLEGRVDLSGLAGAAGDRLMRLGLVSMSPSGAHPGRYGAPLALTVDDLLWYPPGAFERAGYEPPATRMALDALVERLHEDGRVPWCFGMEESDPNETSAAAWIEGEYLDSGGLARYDGWVRGELPSASAEMRSAFEGFGRSVSGAGGVFGGLESALRTPDRIASLPMVALDEPGCWLYRGGSMARATWPEGLAARAAAIALPATRPESSTLLGRVAQVVVLHDRPEVRRFASWLLSRSFASVMGTALCDDGLFPVRDVPAPVRCDLRAQVERLRASLGAGTFRVRALDVLPPEVESAFMGDVGGFLWEMRTSGSTLLGDELLADLAWADLHATPGD
jgi:DNA-binding SARP family transcriptional activator